MKNCCEEAVFLNDDFMDRINDLLRLPDEAVEAYKTTLAIIRNDSELRRRAVDCHEKVFHSTNPDMKEAGALIQSAGSLMGGQSGMFTAVILASGIPLMEEYYQSKQIPREILIDTLSDFTIWMNRHKKNLGVWGISETYWLLNHVWCRLFKIGRLQYIHKQWEQPFHVFRHRRSGQITVFPDAGMTFRQDGMRDGANGIFDPDHAWTSSFQRTVQTVTGHAISRDGIAERSLTTLSLDEWEEVLNAESPVLDMHIQEGVKLASEACRESMKEAYQQFQTSFPEKKVCGYICSSWLLCPSLGRILPETSNIGQFGRLFHIVPQVANDHQAFERVFGEKPADLTTAPRQTSLQSAILDHYLKGGVIGHGAGFILKEEIIF